MNHWLAADPDDILDDVILARQLAGEDIDEASAKVRAMVRSDIVTTQRALSREIVEDDGFVAVYRSIWIDPASVEDFEQAGLGECWAFSRAGAHSYYGRGRGMEVILEARVASDDIVWPMVIAMWSSGEGEARPDSRASVTIREIRTRSGDPVRGDLWDVEHSLRPTRTDAAP
jgi:hypothetical protein